MDSDPYSENFITLIRPSFPTHNQTPTPIPSLNPPPDPTLPHSKEWTTLLKAIEDFLLSSTADVRRLKLSIESRKAPFAVPKAENQDRFPTYEYNLDLATGKESEIGAGVFNAQASGTLEQAFGYWREFPLDRKARMRGFRLISSGKGGDGGCLCLWGHSSAGEVSGLDPVPMMKSNEAFQWNRW